MRELRRLEGGVRVGNVAFICVVLRAFHRGTFIKIEMKGSDIQLNSGHERAQRDTVVETRSYAPSGIFRLKPHAARWTDYLSIQQV